MLRHLTAACLLSVTLAVPAWSADERSVELKTRENAIDVTIGGQLFTTLRLDKSQPKPYFFPVLAADGAMICRPLENPEDHPHHKGIWCSIDEVNGIKFWAEKGKIVNHEATVVTATGNPARIKVVNHWLGEDGQPVVTESAEFAIFADRFIAYDATFTAGAKPVTFDDTKEGMFGMRVANSMRGNSGGQIVNAEGLKTEKECWGQESKWVDYTGLVEGKTYGVTLIDHPLNFRKSRFHVRNYGLFTVSPFGQHAYTNGKLPKHPFNVLDAGKSFRLRYGLYIHPGNTEQANVPASYDADLQAAGQ
ncbi:MAG: PmoA family protein [Planctomycetes bacterium]|nr:PmoA family protein [Planctomycetota bacterium]